jgi:tetratricopeptide (TPR) repeat protein
LAGGTSGAGSYGRLAKFKAQVVNGFVADHGLKSLGEIGCGDGHQLGLLRVERYYGFDISPQAVAMCANKYAGDPTKSFAVYDSASFDSREVKSVDLVISLDVIYHLLEDETYNSYLTNLFDFSDRFVIIYANNTDIQGKTAAHLRFHKFTDWVASHRPEWVLAGFPPNRYPFRPDMENETSFANFYFFSQNEKLDPKYSIFFPDSANVAGLTGGQTEGASPDLEVLMGRARDFFQSGASEDALKTLDRVLAINPRHFKAMTNKGLILAALGRLPDAAEHFKAVLADDVANSEIRSCLAKIYLQQSKWDDLNHFYNELLYLKSNDQRVKSIWAKITSNVENLYIY